MGSSRVANNESSEVIDILLPVTFYFNPSTRLDNVKNFLRFVISSRVRPVWGGIWVAMGTPCHPIDPPLPCLQSSNIMPSLLPTAAKEMCSL